MTQQIKNMAGLAAGLFILGSTWSQETRAFNQNASRSNHTRIAAVNENAPQAAVQNNNTVRSNRGELAVVLADLDGDGVYETDISSRIAGTIAFEGHATIMLDRKPVAVIVNILKTRHETAKNSIGNIR
ncbi:MAG: hypothetical protein J7599_05340 [Niabella sp.]|nr:hypothetical protein [Niabella sp.]